MLKSLENLESEATHALGQLLDIHNLPLWMQKEAHILRGYRPELKSLRQCYHSLWYIHNETVNIWSHLLTGTAFLAFFVWTLLPELHGGYTFSAGDLRTFQFYLLGTTLCLYLSVSCP